jgi:PPOX class probable F420-dependent enzyme
MKAAALPTAHAPRLGYDRSPAETERRVRPMLVAEKVVWLSSVRPDGFPHIVPTWFCWDGAALLVFSKPNAVKVRSLRANPRLMVALGRPEEDFAVALIEAEATLDDAPAAVPDAFFAKYAAELGEGRLDPATFRATYTQAIRVVPTRFVPWHGRGPRHDRPRHDAPRPVRDRSRGMAARLAALFERVAARLRSGAMQPAL